MGKQKHKNVSILNVESSTELESSGNKRKCWYICNYSWIVRCWCWRCKHNEQVATANGGPRFEAYSVPPGCDLLWIVLREPNTIDTFSLQRTSIAMEQAAEEIFTLREKVNLCTLFLPAFESSFKNVYFFPHFCDHKQINKRYTIPRKFLFGV